MAADDEKRCRKCAEITAGRDGSRARKSFVDAGCVVQRVDRVTRRGSAVLVAGVSPWLGCGLVSEGSIGSASAASLSYRQEASAGVNEGWEREVEALSTATAAGGAGPAVAGLGEADAEASLLLEAAGVVIACKADPSRSTPVAASSRAQGASAEVEGRREVGVGVRGSAVAGAGAVGGTWEGALL